MEVRAVKKEGGLFPFDDESKSYFDKLSAKDFIVLDLKKKRNPKFHRKYYAMLRTVAEQLNCGIETLHDYIKDVSGRYDVVSIGGKVMKSYHSISFAKMDQLAFEAYYDESVGVVCDLLGLNKHEVLKELEDEYF